ncbi:MAG: hypothetical protein A2W72_04510 [Burkholderiales bacterium RIFCSPLOWO2_12_67_14]|nr:MAG: hypothetical protein A3I64_15745 [Burkholderiales bacterium RIFCSPLOWO2_02_FULL_67_64]OGB44135.1 MAG: hypothetical protein A3E51_09170 [Burkholderiales bacterium RIFCSPHIGHO2_12_FULL_67_38]OGB45789.1 MAG: hypothetical protein A2W72_04510 [Burkholderiales bacterium RIFCSPLOWO2_12_67_14]OGC00927.1 MAG: hypothetical protein A3G82_11410 [Burkholderiales bacterium RIFCSPLOWO2_12_FULL_67_210]
MGVDLNKDPTFFDRADAHIRLANEHCSDTGRGKVSASLMYGCARFQAWNAATWAEDVEALKAKRNETVKYFVEQYQAMLEENLDDYIGNFEQYMHPEEQQKPPSTILERYVAGKRSFASESFGDEVHDLAGATLDDADFSGCFIVADLRGASLQRVSFRNANVKTCDFTGANLLNATFEGAAIDGAKFDGALLSGASFAGASEQGHIYDPNELPGLSDPEHTPDT